MSGLVGVMKGETLGTQCSRCQDSEKRRRWIIGDEVGWGMRGWGDEGMGGWGDGGLRGLGYGGMGEWGDGGMG